MLIGCCDEDSSFDIALISDYIFRERLNWTDRSTTEEIHCLFSHRETCYVSDGASSNLVGSANLPDREIASTSSHKRETRYAFQYNRATSFLHPIRRIANKIGLNDMRIKAMRDEFSRSQHLAALPDP